MTSSTSSPIDFDRAPSLAHIAEARARLAGHIVTTPLLESPTLSQRIGGRLLVKAECLQRTGSFKFRGALNRLLLIPPADRARGVVAYSSGNHAQGVAAAARLLGVPAVIVMPTDAPALKIANTRDHGAEVVLYDRVKENREEIGAGLARERGLTLVKPFDDAGVIAGQGTAGLEIAEQAAALGLGVDTVAVCCSGGGLASGIAIAVTASFPAARVYTAEPAGFDDAARSMASGRIERNERMAGSICDALMSPSPGDVTFPVMRAKMAGGLVATDDEARHAMREAFTHLKLVLEPGGAVALAAILAGRVETAGKTVVAVASGGNVDPALYADTLKAA
jgi:threonine dehydratase